MFDFKFDWTPDLDSTIEEVDTQHRALFTVGRDMEQLLRIQCIGVTDKQLLDIVCQLRDYTGYHFYEEESLMQEMNYPKYKEHRKMHQEYANYVMKIDLPKLKENPAVELKAIKDEVQRWIFEHMLYHDKEMTNAYLKYKKEQEEKAEKARLAEKAENELVFVEGYGYRISELDATNIYLVKDQSIRGKIVVAYKEKVKAWFKMTALERNTFFGELARVTKALGKILEVSEFDFHSPGENIERFYFEVTPQYADKTVNKENVELSEDELRTFIKQIRRALHK